MNESQIRPSEIYVGLVGAVGTDFEWFCDQLRQQFDSFGYSISEVRLSNLLGKIKGIPSSAGPLFDEPADQHIDSHMNHGDALREKTGRGDPLAMMGVAYLIDKIKKNSAPEERVELSGGKPDFEAIVLKRRAYVFRSLKHPDEVTLLREVYGNSFFLIGVYTPLESRLQALANSIAASRNDPPSSKWMSRATELNSRDQGESVTPTSQNVRDTFALADLFVNLQSLEEATTDLGRFLKMLFGYPFHTPRRDEHCMYHAKAAALRSGSLARQVGAAIATDDGDIIAVGANEVPKVGGGLHWEGDQPDSRDASKGYDTGARERRSLLLDTLSRLRRGRLLKRTIKREQLDRLATDLVGESPPDYFRGAQLRNITEFGREVHAEMAALMDAARRGVGVEGQTLYSTTFPCHNCAKHIVAAGINRVVYIEPYAKSRAADYYPSQIGVDQPPSDRHVAFQPFVGIAPRRYFDLFEAGKRKGPTGATVSWSSMTAYPKIFTPPAIYLLNEVNCIGKLGEILDGVGLQMSQ